MVKLRQVEKLKRGEQVSFLRELCAEMRARDLQQIVVVMLRRDGTQREFYLNPRGRTTEMFAMLEWAKLEIFEGMLERQGRR